MLEDLPVQKLSPKNQVTLPKQHARALDGLDEGSVVCALPHFLQGADGKSFPVLVLMKESELERRENDLRSSADLTPIQKEQWITLLNGHVRRLNLDGQRRVVLPGPFVNHIRIQKDLFLYSNNLTVQIWNPEDYKTYSASLYAQNALSGGLLMI